MRWSGGQYLADKLWLFLCTVCCVAHCIRRLSAAADVTSLLKLKRYHAVRVLLGADAVRVLCY